MGKQLMSIEVRGKEHRWCFSFYGDPAHLGYWRADGLEVIVIENSIPTWWVFPAGWWCFWQDIFNFRNPWRKS